MPRISTYSERRTHLRCVYYYDFDRNDVLWGCSVELVRSGNPNESLRSGLVCGSGRRHVIVDAIVAVESWYANVLERRTELASTPGKCDCCGLPTTYLRHGHESSPMN